MFRSGSTASLNTTGASILDQSDAETNDIVFPHQEEQINQIAVDIVE